MSIRELPVLPAGVEAALKRAVSGEVSFDRLGRAIYSTDASVYQIVPLGVVQPRTEADIVAAVGVCRQLGVPLTARGGGTSQARQCIGPGRLRECSRPLHQALGANAEALWGR